LDAVTDMLPAQTRTFGIEPELKLPAGTGVDAFLDRSHQPWRLYDANVAGPFVPGLPDRGKVIGIDLGSQLPHTQLVDQHGRLVDLNRDFRGKVVLISFIFTRCPDKDECPAISAKFAALQKLLDPNRFHLIEMSLDPVYDSPAVLNAYAKQFGAGPGWSILTGQPHEITHLLNRFGISSLRVSDENFVHSDKVFLTAPDGKVADIVQTVGFSPEGLAAQARHLNGMSSSTFGRLKLALVADVAALCGGSEFAGVVLLETLLFMFIAVVSFTTLFFVARKIFWKNA
jgi:cytochrome oxidase Cu insertion factor (SCO1/SenC/PrrC family)